MAPGYGNYIVSGRTPAGKRVTEFVAAKSGDAAEGRLLKRGYTDVVLHTGDGEALFLQPVGQPIDILASRYLKGPLDHFLRGLRRSCIRVWYLFAIGAALLSWQYWSNGTLDPRGSSVTSILIVVAAAGLLWLAVFVPFVLCLGATTGTRAWEYRRLQGAISWHRWDEAMLQFLDLREHLAPGLADLNHAHILAGLGEVDQALSVLRTMLDGDSFPEWFVWANMHEVYAVARRFDEAVDAGQQAIEHAPSNPGLGIDLALALLDLRQDLPRVQALLDEARTHAISDAQRLFHALAAGILLLERGDAAAAVLLLERARRGLSPMSYGNPRAAGANVDRAHTYLALAHAALSNRTEAKRHYRIAEPRLWALKRKDLRRRCEEAIGFSSSG